MLNTLSHCSVWEQDEEKPITFSAGAVSPAMFGRTMDPENNCAFTSVFSQRTDKLATGLPAAAPQAPGSQRPTYPSYVRLDYVTYLL